MRGAREPSAGALPPAVVVAGLGEARAALAAAGGRPLTLLSPAAAAAVLGPGWWLAMLAEACAAHPLAQAFDLLDCGPLAGLAQAALAAGAGGVVFTGPEAQAVRLGSIARAAGARLVRARPAALDMGAYGAALKLPPWLGAAG